MPNFNSEDWRRFLEPPSAAATVPTERDIEEKNGATKQEGQSAKDNQCGPSADFAALIDAIKREGVAYRKEEQREDRGKKFREWVAIGVISITFVAVCWQVHEMIKVYEPIRLQADAAKEQAAATTKQAETSAQAIIAASRAWVGPLTATMNAIQKDKGLEGSIPYQNTGREPAADFFATFTTKIYSLDEWNSGAATKELVSVGTECLAISNLPSGLQVVYPNTGFSSYQSYFKTDREGIGNKIIATDDLISGKSIFALQGCFTYKSIREFHHSAFCFYYQATVTTLPNLNICNVGNDAD